MFEAKAIFSENSFADNDNVVCCRQCQCHLRFVENYDIDRSKDWKYH